MQSLHYLKYAYQLLPENYPPSLVQYIDEIVRVVKSSEQRKIIHTLQFIPLPFPRYALQQGVS